MARSPANIKGELLVRVQMPEAKAVSGGAAITRDYRNRLDSGRAVRTPTVQQSRDRLHKGVCNYIFDTYGRSPGTGDAMHLMWMLQAHHLDTDFHDRFFRPGAYGATHAAHPAAWHDKQR